VLRNYYDHLNKGDSNNNRANIVDYRMQLQHLLSDTPNSSRLQDCQSAPIVLLRQFSIKGASSSTTVQ